MSKISATVVGDSINPMGDRITSLLVVMPRLILAEFNTHRMFSKNSASSRAIPFEKMVKSVTETPFIPIAWQKEHSGMQGTEYLEDEENDIRFARNTWLRGAKNAIEEAKMLTQCGVTKQLANRKLEPYMWHTVLISGTEWINFFELRCPQYSWLDNIDKGFKSKKEMIKAWKDNNLTGLPNEEDTLAWLKINKGQAEIHMMALAEAMWDCYNESVPKKLEAGEWHIPMIEVIED